MNGETYTSRSAVSAPHPMVYRWEIHQVSNSRHQEGPSGTCITEDSARACVEAALSAAMAPGVYAWGLLSRMPAGTEATAPAQSGVPLAWAAPGPDGTVAWLPHGGQPVLSEVTNGTPLASSGTSLSSLLSRFGGEVHRYRLMAGLSQGELAEGAHCPVSVVRDVEGARRIPSRGFTQQADQLLGADGALVKLWPTLIQSAYPEWFWHIIALEQQASFIQEFETAAIPGLLQTEAYARAIFCAANPVAPALQIEQLVTARLDRQRILRRREPPHIVITLDEAVLRRSIGGGGVMSEQLGHLLEHADGPRMHLQVIPFQAREHPGGMTPFRIMGFRQGPDVLYGETFIGGQTTNDPGQLQQHKLAFNLIQSKALSRDDSRGLIRQLKEELDRGTR